jgi:hypothetical protein
MAESFTKYIYSSFIAFITLSTSSFIEINVIVTNKNASVMSVLDVGGNRLRCDA